MKNKKIENRLKYFGLGIAKCACGLMLAGIIPAGFATSVYYSVVGTRNYDASINDVKNLAEFREFHENEIKKVEERFNNGEIQFDEKTKTINYINSDKFITDYAQSYDEEKYNAIVKSDDVKTVCLYSTVLTCIGAIFEGSWIYAKSDEYTINRVFESGLDEFRYVALIESEIDNKVDNKLKGKPENLPEVNLE